MEAQEYLVSFGLTGEFGRFRAPAPLASAPRRARGGARTARRRDRRGAARRPRRDTRISCPILPSVNLLRRLTPADEQTATRDACPRPATFERGRQLAAELGLPLDIARCGSAAGRRTCRAAPSAPRRDADVRPFVSTLSREFALHILLVDLSRDRRERLTHEERRSMPAAAGRIAARERKAAAAPAAAAVAAPAARPRRRRRSCTSLNSANRWSATEPPCCKPRAPLRVAANRRSLTP